jgi:hypothetical protein
MGCGEWDAENGQARRGRGRERERPIARHRAPCRDKPRHTGRPFSAKLVCMMATNRKAASSTQREAVAASMTKAERLQPV